MNLFDADTDQSLGVATLEQVEASYAEGTETGIILIDKDGNVIEPGSWDAQQPGTRQVYVSDWP